MIGGERARFDPARWLTGFDPAPVVDLARALDEIAERVHEILPADVVALHVVDDPDLGEVTRGYCVGPSPAAQTLAPLLTPGGVDPIGIGDAAREAGVAVSWPRIVTEPGEVERLAAIADAGGAAGALHRLLLDAGGVAVPLGTPQRPALGAIALVSLSRDSPVPAEALRTLEGLAPQVALAARNRQLAVRNRRDRRTLEGVIASSPMGVMVSDVRGRLSLVNPAAGELLGLDLEPLVGAPMATVLEERIKWRVVNPEEYAAWAREVHGDPAREAMIDAETVDGRAISHSSSPVHDPGGGVLGRVDLLHDVTPARAALVEAQRLAAARAAMLEAEERRSEEEVALSRAAHRIASALTPQDIGERLLEQAHLLVPRCEKSAVLAVGHGGSLTPVTTRGFGDPTVAAMNLRVGKGVAGGVVSSARPFICNDTEVDSRISRRITGPEGIRSFMHVPILLGETVYGLVSVNSTIPRAFGERELELITALARHAAEGLRHALRFERERHIAETLQQALIAERLPDVPGLELAALYHGAAGAQVGGDFYSAWRLADGRLALLVGDVSGKGVEAAGITAMVRYLAEALSQHRSDPADLVQELNDMLCSRMPDGSLVTLVVIVVDIENDELAWCSAGHPPAMVLGRGGYRRLSDPDPPCGVFPGQPYRRHVEPFAPGELLFVYTDGLIEARRGEREFGEAALRDVLAADHDRRPQEVAAAAYAAAREWSGGRLRDDVAIAVVTRTAPG